MSEQELIDAERVRFEIEAQKLGCVTQRDSASGEYYNYITNWLWIIWQAAISQHKAVQDGYVLVPKEPTAEMLGEGWVAQQMPSGGTHKICEIYKAMIAAAPSDNKALVESEPNRFIKDPSPQGAGQLIPVKAETVKQDAELTEPMKKVLRYAMAQVQDFEEAECLLHGFRRSTVDKAFTWLRTAIANRKDGV